jgi:signal transduction histidine kinase
MRIQSRLWVSLVASVTVSAFIALLAFSVLRGISQELARAQRYNEVINKAFALSVLIAGLGQESGRRDMQQVRDVRLSLARLLEDLVSTDSREESFIRQIQKNNRELSLLLDQFLAQRAVPGSNLDIDRKNMLATQLWTKVRFITDDTYRLMEISQSRIASAHANAALTVLGLLVAVIFTKTAFSFFSGRRIVRDVQRLTEGVRHISGGDLDHRIPTHGRDELSDLAGAFNGMAASLQASYGRLREYTRKLEQSNRELQDFAFVATHDLQEPLRKIQTFSDRVSAECGHILNERNLDFLARVINAARRMQNLIEALLEYSCVSTKREPHRKVDLAAVVGEVIEDLSARISETQGRVDVGRLPVIEADPTQMRQLFQNLISNALKYHRPGVAPAIQVRGNLRNSGDDGEMCEVEVSDNGIGFDEQFLTKIFTPFQRLHGRGEYEGTGIGLAICRKIVERHGGTITATSTAGNGSTFFIALPARSDDAGPAILSGDVHEMK